MSTATEVPTRDQVPVAETWDLTALYLDEAAWEADAQQVRAMGEALLAGSGTYAASIDALAGALESQAAMSERLERLYIYAMLYRDQNTADASAQERYERVASLAVELSQMTAFLTPEILTIPHDQLRRWMEEPALAIFRHNLDDIDRSRPHVRSAEVEAVLAASYEVARAPENAFSALDDTDLSFGTGHDDLGEEITLTKARVARILQKQNRAARREAWERMASAYEEHRHTLAALHSATVRKDVFYARAHQHPTALDAALFGDNIPTSVYSALIDAVHDALPTFERYLELRRRVLGVAQLAPYDLRVPLAELQGGEFTYPRAVETMMEGLAALGPRYLTDLRAGLEQGRWIDVHETVNKRSGGYNIGPYGAHPYILMNWSGTRDALFTLAHEAGHAMHSFYSNQTQPFPTASYTIFNAEVASTVNETLLTWRLLDQVQDGLERFAVLGQFLDDVHSTIFRQTMFAEFERWTHAQVEAGVALTADSLSAQWAALDRLYFPTVESHPLSGIGWARIPHFYSGFYVFQYATGLSAAIALAGQIRNEGQPAVQRYLKFLSNGGADYSINLLRQAGIDMTTPEPVRAALAEFAARLDEANAIFDTGVVPLHGAIA